MIVKKIKLTEDQKKAVRLWLAALRSGEYTQTTGTLRQTTGKEYAYCCLGVACDVVLKNKLLPFVHWDDRDNFIANGLQSGGLWPPHVRQLFAGDGDSILVYNPGTDGHNSLPTANDVYHWDFNQIAAALEKVYDFSDEETNV